MKNIVLLIPVFFLLIALEFYVSKKQHRNIGSSKNKALNMAIGGIDQLFGVYWTVVFYVYLQWVYDQFHIWNFPVNAWHWILAFVAIDFISYWYHRWSHEINWLWAGHVTHHSSSHFNFSNGFRTSPFQSINRILFWTILPVMGFEPWVLVLLFQISGVYDFFLHTELVPKLRLVEKIFITPSLHRVHHGKNDIYIDKNYGSIFVFWDKLFGTYVGETDVVKFGIKDDEYKDDNPLMAVFWYYHKLWRVFYSCDNFFDKIRLWWMKPGWVPTSRKI